MAACCASPPGGPRPFPGSANQAPLRCLCPQQPRVESARDGSSATCETGVAGVRRVGRWLPRGSAPAHRDALHQAVPGAKSPVSLGSSGPLPCRRWVEFFCLRCLSSALSVFCRLEFSEMFCCVGGTFLSFSLLLFSWGLGACEDVVSAVNRLGVYFNFSISGPALEKFSQGSFAFSLVYIVT